MYMKMYVPFVIILLGRWVFRCHNEMCVEDILDINHHYDVIQSFAGNVSTKLWCNVGIISTGILSCRTLGFVLKSVNDYVGIGSEG